MASHGHTVPLINTYRTWENFGGGKFWQIWQTVGNLPKFSPPIFINITIFDHLPTDSPIYPHQRL